VVPIADLVQFISSEGADILADKSEPYTC
jgi:hypothetical protein